MELQLLLIITLFSVLFAESHAALSPQAYWNSVLPNTDMPKAIKDVLKPAAAYGRPFKPIFNDTTIRTAMGVGKGSADVIIMLVTYELTATATQLRASKTQDIFFLEKDLKLGKSMSQEFTNNDGDSSFLARSDAKKIPFSSEKMSDVFSLFEVKAGSQEGQMMKKTVNECEKPANKGEEKYCATSLESMVDFSTSKLGKYVRAISTEVDKETKLQKYTIRGVRKMKGNENMVCHKVSYPYAVFYCHDLHNTKAYMVSLVGFDGTKANAVAVCHGNTSTWNPRNIAFQMLKVKPGTVPICHYLPEDHIVWVAN